MAFPTINELKPQGLKLLAYYKSKGYRIQALNIVNIRNYSPDLDEVYTNKLDAWDGARVIFSDKGDVLMSASCCTKSGKYYTDYPMNDDGAATVVPGQYIDCWQIGSHFKQYPALVQCDDVQVYRDFNKDGKQIGDKIYTGLFGINNHTTSNYANGDYSPDTVGRWSAGCSVLRWSTTHYNKFMPIVQSMGHKKFTIAYIIGSEFHNFKA